MGNMSWMMGIARTFCRNRMDAEDLVGDTILKVLLNYDKFDTARSFRLWVLVVMRNTFYNRQRHYGVVETFAVLPDSPYYDNPMSHAVATESMNAIEELARMSVGVRCALLYAQGYSYNEIAEMQGVTVNIVKSRIHQGRKLILRKLSR